MGKRESDGKEVQERQAEEQEEPVCWGDGTGPDGTGFPSFPSHTSTHLLGRSVSDARPSCLSSFMPTSISLDTRSLYVDSCEGGLGREFQGFARSCSLL